MGLRDTRFRRLDIFLLRIRRAVSALGISGRNYLALKQLLLTPCIIAKELQLRFLCICVMDCRIDLRGGKVATRSQFRCIQLNDHLAFVQAIAFPRENFLYASS
jgi:hypothetical protein